MGQGVNQVVVAAGNLLFFPATANASEVTDVVNVGVFMELVVSREVSKFSDTSGWRWRYRDKATEFAWVMGASVHSDNLPSADKSFSIWDLVRSEAPAFVDVADVTRGEDASRRSYVGHPTQAAVQLFADHVLHDNAKRVGKEPAAPKEACFLLSFVGPGASVISVQIRFTACRPLSSGFLFETFTSKDFVGNVHIYYSSMTLNRLAYAKYREVIALKLAVKRPGLVHVLS